VEVGNLGKLRYFVHAKINNYNWLQMRLRSHLFPSGSRPPSFSLIIINSRLEAQLYLASGYYHLVKKHFGLPQESKDNGKKMGSENFSYGSRYNRSDLDCLRITDLPCAISFFQEKRETTKICCIYF
jgi:hypothetical protein